MAASSGCGMVASDQVRITSICGRAWSSTAAFRRKRQADQNCPGLLANAALWFVIVVAPKHPYPSHARRAIQRALQVSGGGRCR